MAGETVMTIVGNLTDDPELRFTPGGVAVCSFKVASTPRTYDKKTNSWVDQETLFMRCTVWRQPAEHVAESLQRGMRVIVVGKLESHSFETKEGIKRTELRMEVDEVGPSLRNATAKVTRAARAGDGGRSPAGWGGRRPVGERQPDGQQENPWAPSEQASADGWGGQPGGGYSEEPPF
jgi:single-strand DNA-binding protein